MRYIKSQHYSYRKLILLKDLHEFHEEDIKQQVMNVLSKLNKEICDKFKYVIVKRELEAWFLADPDAIKAVLGHKIEVNDPETIDEPSNYIDSELQRMCKKRYVKSQKVSSAIAQVINVNKARVKSRSFNCFLEIVINN